MTILNLHDSLGIHGGAEVYISELQTLLENNNCKTFWVAINSQGSACKFEEAGQNKPIIADEATIISVLKQFLKDHKVDIINIHNIFLPAIVRACLDLKPVIKFSHSPVMVCPGRDKFWSNSETACDIKYGLHCFWHIYTQKCANRNPVSVKNAYQYVEFEIKEASTRYSKIVVMSEYIRNGLLECGVAPAKILLNPYFTELVDEASMKSTSRSEFRFLFIGRLISSKGPHIMIRSLSKLLKERADIYLDIVGDGLMREELITLVSEAGLEDKVIFHGWKSREEIPRMLSECYAVIFPSIYPEAFGIVGIEAMMHGKPVIAFNVGGVNSWCEHEQTGFCLDRKDTEGISRAAEQLVADEALYNRMSTAAREVALQEFTPGRHLNLMLDMYNKVLATSFKPNMN